MHARTHGGHVCCLLVLDGGYNAKLLEGVGYLLQLQGCAANLPGPRKIVDESVDVTVVNTLAPSHCTTAAGADASHPLRAAEEEKLRRHSDQSSRAGHDYFTAVFTSLGGIHGSFFTDLVLPHFKEETARAKAAGEDTWAITRRKQRLLDRWSVVVARYNAVAIRAVGAGFGRTRRDTGPHKANSTSTHTLHDLSSDDGDDVKENRPRNGGGGRLVRSRAAAASDTL